MITYRLNDAKVDASIKNIMAAFKKLPPEIANKRMKQGMTRATKQFLPTLKSVTPYKTGGLMRSAISKTKTYDRSDRGAVAFIAGFSYRRVTRRTRFGTVEGAGFHAHLVEWGTTGRTRRNGGSTGSMSARHVLTNTLASQQNQILRTIEQELAKSLEKTAEDLGKK